jgi:tetratricopeptide (TPR) repeat protein
MNGIAESLLRTQSLASVLTIRSYKSPERIRRNWQANVSAACLLAIVLALPRPAFTQMDMSSHVMESRDEMPPEKLPVPQKMTGVGTVQLRITAKPEAQMWFNQGLNLIHDFWDYESARAFEQAVRIDPQCAMCYWGLYLAESFYHGTEQDYAGQALAKAVSLKDHATKRERLYIDATAAEVAARKGDRTMLARAVVLWRQLVREDPKEIEAKIFLAQVVDRKENLALLQSVLKNDPENSAANHYYIHALEGTDHAGDALHSAEVLAGLAPASGHMVHMPGHIFFRLGDYARAEKAFDASLLVDERYMREQHVDSDNDWNYVHNIMYAIANLMEEGKFRRATELSMKLTTARGELESTLYIYSVRDSMSRLDPRLPVALRTANWGRVLELLRAVSPPAGRPNLAFLSRQLVTFAAGMQAIEAHDLASAGGLSMRFDAELWRMSQPLRESTRMQMTSQGNTAPSGPLKLQVLPDALLQPIVSILSVMSMEFRGSLLAAQGNTAEAKALFAKAAQDEKALGYREPPIYIRPVGETEGAAMISVGDWASAKAAYQQALIERPKSGFALYGVAMSSERAGDVRAAAKEYGDFLAAWKDADRDLPQLENARRYVSEHSSAALAVGQP